MSLPVDNLRPTFRLEGTGQEITGAGLFFCKELDAFEESPTQFVVVSERFGRSLGRSSSRATTGAVDVQSLHRFTAKVHRNFIPGSERSTTGAALVYLVHPCHYWNSIGIFDDPFRLPSLRMPCLVVDVGTMGSREDPFASQS